MKKLLLALLVFGTATVESQAMRNLYRYNEYGFNGRVQQRNMQSHRNMQPKRKHHIFQPKIVSQPRLVGQTASWTPFMVAAASNNVQEMKRLYAKDHKVVDQTTKGGDTPFMEAARNNAISSLNWFKEKKLLGRFLNKPDTEFGNTALMEVAVAGATARQAYSWLIKHGADQKLKNKSGLTAADIKNGKALINAAMLGNLATVKQLIAQKAPINMSDSNGNTPLINACMSVANNPKKYNAIVRLLLQHGAHVNVVGSHKMTALLEASANNQGPMVHLLLEKGADVNVKNYEGYTPLSIAASGSNASSLKALVQSNKIGKVQIKEAFQKVKELYQKGLDAPAPPPRFKKIHERAVNQLRSMMLLLARHQSPHQRLDEAKDMIAQCLKSKDYLSRSQKKDVMQILGQKLQCPRGDYQQKCGLCSCTDTELTCYCLTEQGMLRKSTVRSNLQDNETVGVNKEGILTRVKHEDRKHPKHNSVHKPHVISSAMQQNLSLAALFGGPQEIKKAKELIKKGADVNYQSKRITAPLINAAINGKIGMVNLLLDTKGIDVNIRSLGGMTPLMYAANNGNLSIVKALLKKHANVHLKSKHAYFGQIPKGSTALDFAKSSLKASRRTKKRQISDMKNRQEIVDVLEKAMGRSAR